MNTPEEQGNTLAYCPNWLKSLAIIVLVAGLLYGGLYVMGYFMPILILIGATLLVTYLLLAPVDWMEEQIRKYLPFLNSPKIPINPRGFAILAVYLLCALLIAAISVKTIPPLVSQVKSFANAMPGYALRVEENILKIKPIGQWYQRLQKHQQEIAITNATSKQDAILNTPLEELSNEIGHQSLQYMVGLGSTTLTTLIYALTMMVLVFYLLLDGANLKTGAIRLLPLHLQGKTAHYLSDIHMVLSTFIKTQLILAVVVGTYLYIIFTLIGVEYAFFLSVFYALASIIPVIGPWFGSWPTLLVVALSEQPMDLVPIIGFLSAFYLLKTYWLMPKIFKTKLEIHPVVMILTLLGCMKLGSIPGLLLAFPLASLICGTQQYILERKAARKQYS